MPATSYGAGKAPISSANSRRAPSRGLSPRSRAPPGTAHVPPWWQCSDRLASRYAGPSEPTWRVRIPAAPNRPQRSEPSDRVTKPSPDCLMPTSLMGTSLPTGRLRGRTEERPRVGAGHARDRSVSFERGARAGGAPPLCPHGRGGGLPLRVHLRPLPPVARAPGGEPLRVERDRRRGGHHPPARDDRGHLPDG